MAAHTLGVVTWLSLAVSLASAMPCCPDGMPMIPLKDSMTCQDLTDLSVLEKCSSFYAEDDFTENEEKTQLQIGTHREEKYCTGISLNNSYATGVGLLNKTGKIIAMVCFPDEETDDIDYVVYAICLLVSDVFLIATFIVYMVLPELRDLQGRCIMCLVFSLIVGYGSLAYLQLPFTTPLLSGYVCIFMALHTYFWMLSAFFWLNINCFNMWRSTVLGHVRVSEERLMRLYMSSGWGLPSLFLLFAFAAQILGRHLNPNIGKRSCWFQGKMEIWVFFYGPVAVLLLFNFLYFLSTALVLWSGYRSPNPMPRVKSLRFKFCLYLKLFLVMGITWIFEVLSAIWDEPWYVTDIINCLQGVIFFTVMVATRKRVWRGLAAKRFCGLHLVACWDNLADEETFEDDMGHQLSGADETKIYMPAGNNTKLPNSATMA